MVAVNFLSVCYKLLIDNHCFHLSGEDYGNSTALVITFTVLNTKDDKFQQMAKEWEKGFLDLVGNYRSNNISVNYSAEVSRFLSV